MDFLFPDFSAQKLAVNIIYDNEIFSGQIPLHL